MKKSPSKVAYNQPPEFFSVLPKSAQSGQAVETHTAFSMFPILDTILLIV